MMNGFITVDGPLHVQVIKTNLKQMWNASLMQDSVRTALDKFEKKYGAGVTGVWVFDNS